MKIELNCAVCGGNHFIYPLKFTSTSVITCADCGHNVGTVAELQRKVMDQLHGPPPEQAS